MGDFRQNECPQALRWLVSGFDFILTGSDLA